MSEIEQPKAKTINYVAEPTLARFHLSPAFFRGVMGPFGSGKSVGMMMELVRLGMAERVQADGWRRSRYAVIRNTYPELKSTTIKTFKAWWPEEVMTWRGDIPIEAHLILKDAKVDIEFIFISLDRPDSVKKLLSLELTGAWVNEAREIDISIINALTGRVGRYPRKQDGGFNRACIIADTNPPSPTNWWFNYAEKDTPQGFEFFKQPPALLRIARKGFQDVYLPNPKAENIRNLEEGFTYYLRQTFGKTSEWINVHLLGKYGTLLSGRPVYPEYSAERHRRKLVRLENRPLLLAFDFGLTPACVIGQLSSIGQLRVLAEITTDPKGPGINLRKFLQDAVKPFLAQRFPGVPIAMVKGDPAGNSRNDEGTNSFKILASEGFPGVPASSNEITHRIDSVSKRLMMEVEPGEPGLVIDESCEYLCAGAAGLYCFKRVAVLTSDGEVRYRDEPDKNAYSHPHDALQYLADGVLQPSVTNNAQAAKPVQDVHRHVGA